jgi:DNA-binding Xre family transcriptional regulator
MKHIKNIKEFVEYDDLDNELLEMANFTKKTTGIDDVVIWIGPNPPNHGRRIKASNKPNSFDPYDTFTITIPDLKIIGDVNSKFIKEPILNKIFQFIEVNIEVITEYSDRKISTEELIERIKKVK